MSIALQNKVNELERRIAVLEAQETIKRLPEVTETVEPPALTKIWGEIKTIKMRMARNDGK